MLLVMAPNGTERGAEFQSDKNVLRIVDKISPMWETVIADMENTAQEYRDAGLNTTEIHPLDVVPVTPSQNPDWTGIDIVLADNEFDDVAALIEERDVKFVQYDVYRKSTDDVALVLVAMKDPGAELALLLPIYYELDWGAELLDAIADDDSLTFRLRRLKTDRVLEIDCEKPELVLGTESDE